MKKFIIIVFSLLTFLTYHSKSDIAHPHCPYGYDTEKITIPIHGCDYSVSLCLQCDYGVSTTDTSKVSLLGFSKDDTCSQTWSTQQIKDYIVNYISNPAFLHSLCLQQGFPPCSEPPAEPVGIKYSVEVPMCWCKYSNPNGTLEYFRCLDGNTCSYCYYICMDPIDQVPVIVIYNGPYSHYSGLLCFSLEPPDPPIGTSTECFSVPTLCNP